jgi:hypothetical protein
LIIRGLVLIFPWLQSKQAAESRAKSEREAEAELVRFAEGAEGVAGVTKRKLEADEATALTEASHVERRRRLIDETDAATRREGLKQVSPWIPMFTPGRRMCSHI